MFENPAPPLDSAPLDVSSQYADQRRVFAAVLIVLGVGAALVEVLSWFWIREYSSPAGRVYGVDLLVLIAAGFTALLAFAGYLLRVRAIRAIRVDESGIHVIRFHGSPVILAWRDREFRVQFRERMAGPGVRSSPPPEFLRVVGRGFPVDLGVPFRAYELALGAARHYSLNIEAGPETVQTRHGPIYGWVTTLRAPE